MGEITSLTCKNLLESQIATRGGVSALFEMVSMAALLSPSHNLPTNTQGEVSISQSDAHRLVALIEVINQCKIADTVRSLLTTALFIAPIALGIISGWAVILAAVGTTVSIGHAGYTIYGVYRNQQAIDSAALKSNFTQFVVLNFRTQSKNPAV